MRQILERLILENLAAEVRIKINKINGTVSYSETKHCLIITAEKNIALQIKAHVKIFRCCHYYKETLFNSEKKCCWCNVNDSIKKDKALSQDFQTRKIL